MVSDTQLREFSVECAGCECSYRTFATTEEWARQEFNRSDWEKDDHGLWWCPVCND